MSGLLPTVEPHRQPLPAELERLATDAALGGAGWSELLGLVRTATGRHCRLVALDGALLASTGAGSGLSSATARAALAGDVTFVTAGDGWQARAVPVSGGGQTLGLVLLAEPASEHQLDLLRSAGTALAIEAVRRDATRTARFDGTASVIAALRRGEIGSAPGGIVRAAGEVGLDLDRPGCGGVLRYSGARHRAWASAITWLNRPVECAGTLARLVVADGRDLQRVRERVELSAGPGTVRAACGATAVQPSAYRASFAEAERLLRVAGRDGPDVLPYADAGLLQLLMESRPERLRGFVDRQLGPVLARPDLLATLRAWLASSGSRRVVSDQLHLHRNSVGYRVGLVKTLLGVDPLKPEHAAALLAALAAHDLLASDADELS